MIAARDLTVEGIASGLAPHVAANLAADRAEILATASGPVKRLLVAKALDVIAADATIRLIVRSVVRGARDWVRPAAPALSALCALTESMAPRAEAEYLSAFRRLIADEKERPLRPPFTTSPAPTTWDAYNR